MVYVKLQRVHCACGWIGKVHPGDSCESCGAPTQPLGPPRREPTVPTIQELGC